MTDPRLMEADEQMTHRSNWQVIRTARATIADTQVTDEDICVAIARLDNWLTENEGRWTK